MYIAIKRLATIFAVVALLILAGCPPERDPALAVSAFLHDFGTDTGPWALLIWNGGDEGTTLNFTLVASAAWIQLSLTGGSSTSVTDVTGIDVTINTAALSGSFHKYTNVYCG